MKLKFSKMHGLGNDFMVIDGINQSVELNAEQIAKWADRNRGIGFDQLLMVEPPKHADVDFTFRIFNADGSEAEQCGNGARCFAHYVIDKGLTDKTQITVETVAGKISMKKQDDGMVTVNMGRPIFEPEQIPFVAKARATQYSLDLFEGQVRASVLSMGNPHCILLTDNIATAPLATIGQKISQLEQFSQGVNVSFMQVVDKHQVNLRVLERGTGETQACGSGACAAAVAGCVLEKLVSPVTVHLQGGDLIIDWDGDDQPVWMTGSASHVFDGVLEC